MRRLAMPDKDTVGRISQIFKGIQQGSVKIKKYRFHKCDS